MTLTNNNFENNDIDIAVFNKKNEYEGATLNLISANNHEKLNIFLGTKNKIISDLNLNIKNVKNKYLNSLIY